MKKKEIQIPRKGSPSCALTEEHSMERYRYRPELSERFGSHWSIWISGEIRMDQWPLCLVFREIRMDQWCWKFVKSSPLDWHWSMDGSSQFNWNNRKGGSGEGGTPQEPLPNTTKACFHTCPRCIRTNVDTYRNSLFLQSSVEKSWAHALNAPLRLTRVRERIFAVPLSAVAPPFDYSDLSKTTLRCQLLVCPVNRKSAWKHFWFKHV